MVRPSKGDSQSREQKESLLSLQPSSKLQWLASSEPKVELDSHVDTCVVDDNCLVIHDHNRPANIYSYDPKDCYRSVKTVNATVDY